LKVIFEFLNEDANLKIILVQYRLAVFRALFAWRSKKKKKKRSKVFLKTSIIKLCILLSVADYQVWDRCYRLRHNENQVRVDRTFTFGLLTATAVSLIAKYPVVNGVIISIPLSLLLAAFYNAKVAEKVQKSVTDEIQHTQSISPEETEGAEASEEKWNYQKKSSMICTP